MRSIQMRGGMLLPPLLLLATLVYWPGLHGPFVFDDFANFAGLQRWIAGDIGWRKAMFGVDSGLGGRPLSMASFMLSALPDGVAPFWFKFGNLLIHLANATLAYALFRSLATRDRHYAPHAATAALVLAALWLLHPLLVSTVLYAVQRMAMLSATFVLAGLLAYWHGRIALDAGRARRGWLLLFAAVPACTLVGAAAKENALLLPLLCAVLEAVYFRPDDGHRRPLAARAFLWLGVALPIALGIVAFVGNPQRLLGAYADRSFTLGQRLLTESRIVWDYVASVLLPWGPRLSLYRDDYVVSTSLLSPPTTLLALAAWAGVLVLAWRVRRSMPALAAGIGLFLVGHAMESTVVPLLLYFEHRNYLPAIGLLWAAGGVLLWLGARLAPRMDHPRRVFAAATVLLVLAFAAATHARAWIWRDKDALIESALRATPDSRWLRMDAALTALQHARPDAAAARRHYAVLQRSPDPVSRAIGARGQVLVDCAVDGATSPVHVARMFEVAGQPFEPDQYLILDALGELVLRQPCRGLPADAFGAQLARSLDHSPTAEGNRVKVNSRYLAARLLLAGGRPDASLAQARIALHNSPRELPLAAMVIGLELQLGRPAQARALLDAVRPRIPADDRRANAVFDAYRRALDAPSPHGR